MSQCRERLDQICEYKISKTKSINNKPKTASTSDVKIICQSEESRNLDDYKRKIEELQQALFEKDNIIKTQNDQLKQKDN